MKVTARNLERRKLLRVRKCRCALGCLTVVALTFTCSAPAFDDEPGKLRPHSLRGDEVARVGGKIITKKALMDAMRRFRLSPRAALRKLEDELLLSAAASQRHMDRTSEVYRLIRRVSVQELLRDRVELPASPMSVTAQEIATLYEKRRSQYHKPERRESVHVLAQVSIKASPAQEAQARHLAEMAIEDFKTTSNPEQVLLKYQSSAIPVLMIRAERVPPLAKDDAAEQAYKQALFSQAKLGVIEQPVRTNYGWHAIFVTKHIAAQHVSLEQARSELRAELVILKRRSLFLELMRRLERSTPVNRNEAAIRRIVTDQGWDQTSRVNHGR